MDTAVVGFVFPVETDSADDGGRLCHGGGGRHHVDFGADYPRLPCRAVEFCLTERGGRDCGVVHAFVDGIRIADGVYRLADDCGRVDGQFVHGLERFGSTKRIDDGRAQNEHDKKFLIPNSTFLIALPNSLEKFFIEGDSMLKIRPRRLRLNENLRSMICETNLSVKDLVYPIFVVAGENVREEIPSMPDCYHLSVDNAVELAKKISALGIPAIEIFGLPEYKDEVGSSAWDMKSPVQRAIAAIKKSSPELVIVGDVCLCQYTSHGHCGKLCGHYVDNDETLKLLQKVAVSQAEAGADIIAPSDMMDGRVAVIRDALDEKNFSNVSIMSYAVKYASAYYGPFRDAADSAPQFGDRKQYQMDFANVREALKEVELDLAEGADIIMIKPALAYLDIVSKVREKINRPVAVYNVSGEYAMVKAAAANGWIDYKRIVVENLTAMKRAGADIIITYHALDFAQF